MWKFITRATVMLTLIFAMLMIVVISQPSDPAINEFFRLDDCTMPCWQGIQPGETRIDDAIDILQAHPWTGQIEVGYDAVNQSGLVKWKWSADAPLTAFDTGGSLNVRENLVSQIDLETLIPLGEVWLRFGTPDIGDFFTIRGNGRTYLGFHETDGIDTENTVDCPLTSHSVWESATMLQYLAEERLVGGYTDPRITFRQMCR